MSEEKFSNETLNLFIDGQLDVTEMDAIHHALLDDATLRESVCQLKAVRELVGYAYEQTPEPQRAVKTEVNYMRYAMRGVAAGILLGVGALSGWAVNDRMHTTNSLASASDVFQYFKFKSPADRTERKIILHVTTGDIAAVNAALNEAEQLLASYHQADTPMRLDIVTYKDGINMLRVGVSPYVKRIASIIETNDNVAFYACQNSIAKAVQKEGKELVLMPAAITHSTAKDLISERIEKGWVYIKV